MYLVRFLRKDDKPTEEYCYNELKDAREHFELFREDDSDLYQTIQIIEEGFENKEIDSFSFALGSWARLRLDYLREYCRDEYERLKEAGVLSEHLETIEQAAQQMFETTMEKLKASGVEMSQASMSMFSEEHTLEHIVFR